MAMALHLLNFRCFVVDVKLLLPLLLLQLPFPLFLFWLAVLNIQLLMAWLYSRTTQFQLCSTLHIRC